MLTSPIDNYWMATCDKRAVGTVALKKVQEGIYEFTKMAVNENYQGLGIGKALAQQCVDDVKAQGGHSLILFSNTKLISAIALYHKMGFVEVPLDGIYKRSDIKMELKVGC